MPTTFISYRRDDAAGYAGRLREALEQRVGEDQVFRDVDTLEPGQDFVEAIEVRLRDCQVFLAMIGREWLDARDASGNRRLDQANDYVRLEIASALARRDVRVIPVLIENASMPPAAALPEDIRPLAHRQAIYLRDDAWDHDVDRLAAVIAGATAAPAGRPVSASHAEPLLRSRWLVLGLGGIIVAVLLWLLVGRDASDSLVESSNPGSPEIHDGSPVTPARGSSGSSMRGQPYGIAIPRVAEVAHTSLIYTLLSGMVIPLGHDSSELRLRFRFSNEGRYDANAWDASFRLVVGGATLAPTSGLNDVVPGHSLSQGIVTFAIPADAGDAVLRVIEGSRVAELPLALSATGRPAEDERADAGDALSRAIVRSLVREPTLLVRDDGLSVTVERGTARRFANVVRLSFALRLANLGRIPVHSSDTTLRIAAGDRGLAPIEAPNVVIEAQSTATTDVEFEVPASTTRAVLRGTIRGSSGEMPLEVP